VGAIGLELRRQQPPAQQVAHLPVGRAGAGAAEREIAQARRTGQGLGLHAGGRAQPRQLGVAAHHQHGAGLFPRGDGLGEAGDDGDDALVGAGQLDPGQVRRFSQLERGAGERRAKEGQGGRPGSSQQRAGGLLAREICRQQGPGQRHEIGGAALGQQRLNLPAGGQRPAHVQAAAGVQDG
jgi:hypothetical protein